MRGYLGVASYALTNGINAAGIFRSAHAFNANILYTIGARYRKAKADTSKSPKHLPLIEYPDWETFKKFKPRNCKLVGVEYQTFDLLKVEITNYTFPERCIIVMGAETGGLNYQILRDVDDIIYIDTKTCLNVASCATAIMLAHHLQRYK